MDITITLLPETDSVYLLSGRFFEGEVFTTTTETVIYLTVLPLDARFVPYTVKLIGAGCDSELALCCKLSENEYAIRLGRRFFVYSSQHSNVPEDKCVQFFYYVKGKHFDFARELLSAGLSGLSDGELTAFLSDYTDLIRVKDKYYAVDKKGVGHLCVFEYKDGKIDNISID
ncbi:MAG: hypothetical protein J1F36_06880 [Clostridiales bacterium]|nr:hypothetical protein [Clostridiales bacterium]